MGTPGACKISQRTISGWDALVLESDRLRVAVIPEKGADIYEFVDVASGLDVLFKAPWGLLPPGSPPRPEADGLEFIGNYEGCWQELLPNANDACVYEGVDLPFHGEAALLPWEADILQDGGDALAVKLSVRCRLLPFRLERTMRLASGNTDLVLEETVTNDGPGRLPFVWGHHLVLGPPFIEERCRLELPARSIETADQVWEETARLAPGQRSRWPHAQLRDGSGTVDLGEIPGPDDGSHDDLFVGDFSAGWATVVNDRLGVRFRLSWDAALFPWLVLWQPYGGATDPSLAGSYGLGVEPWTYRGCLEQAVEAGQATWLESHASLSTTVTASIERLDRA